MDDHLGTIGCICLVLIISMFSSCTYFSSKNYNDCVIKASRENAVHCKAMR